jgi:hypothetical protein
MVRLSQKNGCGVILDAAVFFFYGGKLMNNKKIILAIVAIVVVIGLMAGIYFATRPQAEQGSKAFTVTVVHGDGTEKTFNYRTDGDLLGTVLEEKGLILADKANPGMFHTVDGEKADWNVNKSYWAFYVGEDYAMTGIYDTHITDGASYKLVYTLG